MGRFWLGVGLLLLFLALGLWTSAAMDDVHLDIADTLDTAAQNAIDGDWEAGISLAQDAKHQWDAQWHATASVADHAPMDEIDSLFAQLEIYGQTRQITDFAAYCARISRLITAVGEAHSLNWWNLL